MPQGDLPVAARTEALDPQNVFPLMVWRSKMLRRAVTAPAMLCMAFILALATAASAQLNAGIQGTVTDSTGAAVNGASVSVTNQATGVTSTTVTGDTGFYRVPGLPPGQYTVKIAAATFKTYQAKDVAVAAEQIRGFNAQLSPGPATESITVTGAAPALQTENATISSTLTSQQLLRLPDYGRDPYELLRLAPGIFGDGARDGSGNAIGFVNGPGPGGSNSSIFQTENQVQISANGQRVSANNFTIDGTSVNSQTWGGAAIVTPNQESVQEVVVLSNAYSAEDGRNSGAQVKVVSKSGTNAFHGSGFFKYDEPGLNAYQKWGGPNGEAPQRVNNKLRQFGGSIGGPILKDKLFFFFSYEGDRSKNYTTSTNYIESPELDQWIAANRAGTDVGQMMGLGTSALAPPVLQVLTPSCGDLAGQWPSYSACALASGSMGTGLDVGSPSGSYGQYVDTWTGNTAGSGLDNVPDLMKVVLAHPSRSSGNQFNGRVDFTHGKNQFSGSVYYTPRNDFTSNDLARASQNMVFQPRNGYIALLWNRTISATTLNEARFNVTRWTAQQYSNNSGLPWGLPRMEVEMIPLNRISYGPPQGDNSPGMFAQNQFEWSDTLSHLVGRHALKFGFSFDDYQDNNNYMFGSSRPIFVYHGLWNFVNGAPIYEGVNTDPATGQPTVNQKYFRQHDYAFFVQDDIKLRPNLTVNLGLRYEYFEPLNEKDGKISNLVLGSGATALQTAVLKTGNPLYQPDRNNFGPRVGFAWAPTKLNNKTVFRGGFGVMYNRITDTMTGISRVNPPYVFRWGLCCAMTPADNVAVGGWALPPYGNGLMNEFPLGSNINSIYNYGANPFLANLDPSTGLPTTGSVEIWGAPQNMRTPYVYVYSAEVQQELPWSLVATLGYQGSSSHKLLRIVNQNFIYSTLNPNLSAVYFPTTDASAHYNAFLANLSRHFRNGLQFFAKYSLSASKDTLTGEGAGAQTNQFYPVDQRYDMGPSDFDAKHNLLFTAMYDLPIFRHRNDLVGRVLGGWHIDGTFQFHSGFPWSPKAWGANCLPIPAGGTLCPALPTAAYGGWGDSSSTSTFQQPGGNFPALYPGGVFDPNGWQTYFGLGTGVPAVNRNSFRGPRYSTVDLSLAKTTRIPFITKEGASWEFRANFYNAFNKLNLRPFGYFDGSTIITDPHFGEASGALAGRVIEFQTRLNF